MENSTDFDENVEKNDEKNIYNIFSSLYYPFSLPTYRSKIRYAIKILGTITLSNQRMKSRISTTTRRNIKKDDDL